MNCRFRIRAVLLLSVFMLPAWAQNAAPPTSTSPMSHPLSWNEVEQLPLPPAGERIAYGSSPQEFGELRVPAGKGPFPVVILVHGGCWLADFDYIHITRLAAAMVQMGIATWTIEYRRLGDAGGGWPNTFLDVARAGDYLRPLARRYPLDLSRVAAAGHSAGGQLALWLAARGKLPRDSELYMKQPLKLAGVIGLAAITDLNTYRNGPPSSCNASVDRLLGGSPETMARRYAQTSPLALLPLSVPQWLIQGELDHIVAPASASVYVEAARAKGDAASLRPVTGAAHFEMVVPQPPAWPVLQAALRELFRLEHGSRA